MRTWGLGDLMATVERSSEAAPEAHIPDDLQGVLELGRQEIDHQFRVSERLDAKARGQLTLAATWFAVVQVVAGFALDAKLDRLWTLAIISALAAGAISLVIHMAFSASVWRGRKEKELTHTGFRWLADNAIEGSPEFRDKLLAFYQAVIGTRRLNNKERSEALGSAQLWWYVTVLFGLAELVTAVLARLYGT